MEIHTEKEITELLSVKSTILHNQMLMALDKIRILESQNEAYESHIRKLNEETGCLFSQLEALTVYCADLKQKLLGES
tara:strand:+ start:227 stop:460 length:234 start_codon:yes stop_codon:yes gene_type:complete